MLLTQLRTIIKAVRGSPQQRQYWFAELHAIQESSQDVRSSQTLPDPFHGDDVQEESRRSKILLLDVRTRWSSTHIMLGTNVLVIIVESSLTSTLGTRARDTTCLPGCD
jgi:hypothetical protein